MKPTMNQPDTKCVLLQAIFVAAFSTLSVVTCPEKHFQLQESLCCLNCPEGMYVAQNCSGGPMNYVGVLCNPCRRCEELGEITVSQCTQFSDTRCASKQITSYGSSSVIAAVFMLAVIVAACFFCRISKSGESDESSAGEPFHISV
ncbi:CD27 antigen-like [Sinocyclocheilus rhinocerous]|uniref:CD27 antigen-like n=1 Tax=Sinocyclocheilus rhinocerous TaxID=307959 RepID=UPI0007B98C7A|nr:PREDICTED: CD27 antigen-like [Sinocyclocheilus rhinocerous]